MQQPPGKQFQYLLILLAMKDVFANCVSIHEKLLEIPFADYNDEIIFHEKVFPLEQNILAW